MASFKDLACDWASLCQECPECWTSSDLQLAAELGKTLLERNKELETALRQHQNVVEDQAQEIEYLTKQTVALREVNDSRLRIYEQLEVSIQDLERANHRLALDHTNDKKYIKSLCSNIETLEGRCDELQKTIEDLKSQLDTARKRAERKPEPPDESAKPAEPREYQPPPTKPSTPRASQKTSSPTKASPSLIIQEHEDLMRLSEELREGKAALATEQRRVTELEEQLASIVQENNRLRDQVRECSQRQDEPKSINHEFSILEEVRQGQMCARCLRGTGGDDLSSAPDDDDTSAVSSLYRACSPAPPCGSTAPPAQLHQALLNIQSGREAAAESWRAAGGGAGDNPYRELVQKYEALLDMQLSQASRARPAPPAPVRTKPPAHTPDFSEAETSSSGFADETSNKATQTERERPGSFLCTIADGPDRFSIYDDAAPVQGRFRDRPEYRELFKEIFTILKKAAESKDEGETLPLLDDSAPPARAPPVTPAAPPAHLLPDDAHSVYSSLASERSLPLSDAPAPSAADPAPAEPPAAEAAPPPEPAPARLPPDYSATARKKSRHRRRPSAERGGADSPVFPSPPRIVYQKGGAGGRKRREYRPPGHSPLAREPEWSGNTLQFYNRSLGSPARPTHYQAWNPDTDAWETRHSTASHEIHKLRKLELSYAEVLRNADTKSRRAKRQ